MDGKCDFCYKCHIITFDFDSYTIFFHTEIPIEIWEEIIENDEYKLLFSILEAKHAYIKGFTENPCEYNKLCGVYKEKYQDNASVFVESLKKSKKRYCQ